MLALLPALRERIGEYIFAEEETTLEAAIGKLLLAKNLTMGTAESCTGGLVAQRLTSVSGSSAYFRGGIVAYHNDIKQEELG